MPTLYAAINGKTIVNVKDPDEGYLLKFEDGSEMFITGVVTVRDKDGEVIYSDE